jgi:mono/diheme cytochrome c family protein
LLLSFTPIWTGIVKEDAMRSVGCLFGLALAVLAGPAAADAERGKYLATIMDCGGCHTPGYLMGKPDTARMFAGSEVGFFIPDLGYVYPPNLTSDEETGLGKWSEADIIKAVTKGERPDGRILAPIMPYHNYAALTEADAKSLAGFIKSLKPIKNKAPALTGPSEKAPSLYMRVEKP